jgi:myo-inositol 2-dehydrogenase/D-chiro-inositol 1-dehydrogenase
MLIHDFDLARVLVRDDIVEVFADETNLVVDSKGIERFADNVTVSMHFQNGALGHSHTSMHAGNGYNMRTMYQFADAFKLEMEAFVRCLIDGKLPEVNQDDALAAYRVFLAATESAGKRQPIRTT